MPFAYFAEAELDDGSRVALDLEEHGWADKELLARTVRWSLIPRTGLPLVVVNIPPGGKPVFKSRVYGTLNGPEVPFRCYATGFHLHGRTFWTWVLPNGSIEVGDDPSLADLQFAEMRKR